MGIIDGLLGNASEVGIHALNQDLASFLSEGEVVEKAYKVIRDLFIFSNKRLILIDKLSIYEVERVLASYILK